MPERGETFTFNLREASGALGDLGTLLPLMLGAIAIADLSPKPVLLGFAAFYLASALYYRLPIPVQPMKAVAAVLLTAEVSAAGLAASGVMLGLVLLLLGVTGWISRLGRLVPQSVLAGLQLGLGLSLAVVAFDLMQGSPVLGVLTLALLLGLLWLAPRTPAALIALVVSLALAQVLGAAGLQGMPEDAAAFALPGLPTLAEIERAGSLLVLPQLSLTFTNAVILTALLAGDYFGDRATHVTPARLSITSGLANLALVPFGAMPMCHGAGGLAAHHRFGARSGTAPLLLGLGLLLVALLPAPLGLAALSAIPAAALGAMLLAAAGELAMSRRLFDCKPSCWPVIAVTAAVTLWADPFWGLLAGGCSEVVRHAIVRSLLARSRS